MRDADGEGLTSLGALASVVRQRSAEAERLVVAIAGPPAAGKSTVAEALRGALGGRACVLGLDAFHYDDAVLIERSQRPRKGAPFTFDVDGYSRCLRTLIEGVGTEVAVPVFDRDLELSRNSAEIVAGSCDIVITEGNYLLLGDEPWVGITSLFDVTVYVEAPMATVRTRILERWRGHGLPDDEARLRAEHNDLPNAELVSARSQDADYVLSAEWVVSDG